MGRRTTAVRGSTSPVNESVEQVTSGKDRRGKSNEAGDVESIRTDPLPCGEEEIVQANTSDRSRPEIERLGLGGIMVEAGGTLKSLIVVTIPATVCN